MDWYSKKQKKSETAMYRSKFLTYRTALEHIIADCNYLLYLGVPVENVTHVFGNNESEIGSCTVPESKLNKRHNILSYHFVRNTIACKFINLQHVSSEWNMANVVSKHWSYQKVYNNILKPVLHYKGNTKVLVIRGIMDVRDPEVDWLLSLDQLLDYNGKSSKDN